MNATIYQRNNIEQQFEKINKTNENPHRSTRTITLHLMNELSSARCEL